jgi:hypothetical protein
MWKKVLVVAAAALALGVAATGWWCWQDHEAYCDKLRRAQQVTRDNFYLVVGRRLNRTQAEALLGPPGDYRTRSDPIAYYPDYFCPWAQTRKPPTEPGYFRACWSTDGARITIWFDRHGLQLVDENGSPVACDYEFALTPPPARDPPWWQQALGRLGL